MTYQLSYGGGYRNRQMKSSDLHRRVADNLEHVRDNITRVAQGREITLVCVTKYAQTEWIRALVAAGATDLAENYLPEAAERFGKLFAEGVRFKRHLIGPPQSRKVKYIPGNFDLLQAMDRIKIARLLDDRLTERNEKLDVLLQVNISREPQKHGVDPDMVGETVGEVLESCLALRLRGLMAVPPWPDAYDTAKEFERQTRIYFGQMRAEFDRIRQLFPASSSIDILSLGMSQDYTWAVEDGATMVRVGSALYEGL